MRLVRVTSALLKQNHMEEYLGEVAARSGFGILPIILENIMRIYRNILSGNVRQIKRTGRKNNGTFLFYKTWTDCMECGK